MSAPQSYEALVSERHQVLRTLNQKELPLIGYIYPHTPIELFLAHELLPTLLWADPTITSAYEASIQTFCCAYSRNLFSQRAKERLPKLAAIAFPGGTCDSLQNLGDIWRARFPDDTIFRLIYPIAKNDTAVHYFAEELRAFNNHLEITLGTSFSLDRFSEAVALIAEFRAAAQFIAAARLLQTSIFPFLDYVQLIRRFLTAPGPNTLNQVERAASDVQTALRKDQLLPSTEALRYGLLRQQVGDMTLAIERNGPRIAVVGGMIDPEGIGTLFANAKEGSEIETAEIVFDLLSFTFRTIFTPSPSLQGDPFQELARSLLAAPAEPTQEGLPQRMNFIEALFKKIKIDGIIVCEQSFCDPDQFEVPELLKIANKMKISTVRLPLDPEFSDRARLEGRIQSFLETLSMKR